MGLTAKTCTPCRGGVPPLTPEEAQPYHAQTPKWKLLDNATRLKRSFEFGNFMEAMAFAEKVGRLSEEEGHHPDITFGWGYCEVTYYTHKINGLHENDFIMAAKVDALLA
jgi:4a-hydroxytetrahydrobiopterin dehydratase